MAVCITIIVRAVSCHAAKGFLRATERGGEGDKEEPEDEEDEHENHQEDEEEEKEEQQ